MGSLGDPSAKRRLWARRGYFETPFSLQCARRLAKEIREGKNESRKKPVPMPTCLADLYSLNVQYGDVILTFPNHLWPFLNALDKAFNGITTVCLSVPPQHQKTTTTLMALAYDILTKENREHYYISYSATRSHDVGKDFSYLLNQLGVPHTLAGGVVTFKSNSVRFVSMAQGITGYSVNGLCIVDDPYKNGDEAKGTVGDTIWRQFNQNVFSRQIGKMSIIVIHTRWDTNDLIGRLQKQNVPYINIKAICDDDDSTALEDRDPLVRAPGETLLPHIPDPGRQLRDSDERQWFCMYQGEPSPEGLRLFEAETTYAQLPNIPMKVLYGLDSAYAAKNKSDWSVCMRFLFDPKGKVAYLDKVIRVQVPLEKFGKLVAEMQNKRPGPIVWFTGGQEQYAAADILRREGVKRLECRTARGQLRIRAGKVSVAWNNGRVLVPINQDAQLQLVIEEITNFIGDDKAHDDCVAAMHGALHDAVTNVQPPVQPGEDPLTSARQMGAQAGSGAAYERRLVAAKANQDRNNGVRPGLSHTVNRTRAF